MYIFNVDGVALASQKGIHLCHYHFVSVFILQNHFTVNIFLHLSKFKLHLAIYNLWELIEVFQRARAMHVPNKLVIQTRVANLCCRIRLAFSLQHRRE